MKKPVMPEFPKNWYKHCPKVLEAKEWYGRLVPHREFVEEDHAECAFVNAGVGKKCENCRAFLTRPFTNHKVDEEFLPLIEQFYRDLEQYEKDLDVWQSQQSSEVLVKPYLTYEEAGMIIEALEFHAKKSSNQGDRFRNIIAKIQTTSGYLENSGLI